MLVRSGQPTSSLPASILIATTNRVDLPSSLSSHHPAFLDTPAHLFLLFDIFLEEASISEVSKKIAFTVDESSRHNSSCVNNSQSFNPNYQSSTEVPVVQPHIITVP